jgi:hypothetical protein
MIWTRDKISIADELMELAPKLREEFLEYHKDFDTTFKGGTPYSAVNSHAILDNVPGKVDWKVEGLRYAVPEQKVEHNMFQEQKVSDRFPTAAALTKKYQKHCCCSGYSILEPYGLIKRHMDVENRSHVFVRIHIPLIIPEGEIGLEVSGHNIKWTDLFAFDNGEQHSAYNRTKKRRLIYIIDITREFLSIPKYERNNV